MQEDMKKANIGQVLSLDVRLDALGGDQLDDV